MRFISALAAALLAGTAWQILAEGLDAPMLIVWLGTAATAWVAFDGVVTLPRRPLKRCKKPPQGD
jgi:hypothetical protein